MVTDLPNPRHHSISALITTTQAAALLIPKLLLNPNSLTAVFPTANAVFSFNRSSARDVILGPRICLVRITNGLYEFKTNFFKQMLSLATEFERLLFFAMIIAAKSGVLAKMWLSLATHSMTRSAQFR
jgi:hypothetical protein